MLTFVGFGHSHIVAIAKGCYELQQAGETFNGEPFLGHFFYLYGPEFTPVCTGDAPGAGLNPQILEKIEQANPRFVLLVLGGNEHNVLSVVQLRRRFDFILGAQPDLPLEPGADIVPEAVVRELVRERMEETFETVRLFRHAVRLPIAHMEPPPPLPNEQVSAYPGEFFKSAAAPEKLSAHSFRYKMWRVQADLYRELCEANDIVHVPVPGDLQDEQGMLAKAAWGRDATHANAHFGRRMTEELMRRIGERIRTDG